jgi:hypothetical protein
MLPMGHGPGTGGRAVRIFNKCGQAYGDHIDDAPTRSGLEHPSLISPESTLFLCETLNQPFLNP